MKKIISKIMAVIGIMLCMIPMAACQDESPRELNGTYIILYDGIGNEYGLYEGRENVFEYEYKTGTYYNFSYTVFNRAGEEIELSQKLSSMWSDDSGKHRMTVYYGSNIIPVCVIIKEKPRLTPEVSFDPMGTVDYIENERYVYEYDGEEHYPHIKLSYDGEELLLRNDGAFGWKNCETPNLSRGVEVGEYTMIYSVTDESFRHYDDMHKYQNINMEITVAIIPAE